MTVLLPEFVQRIADSGLIAAADVQAFIDELPENAKPLDTKQLAKALVREEKLTPYQAQAIYSGKGSQLTLGNYVILGGLGKGGMGVVFKAVHRRMHRVVAIKTLNQSSTKDPSLAWRFKREVRAAAMLEHPNIVTAYDADESGGRPFLVMQYVDGNDLSSLVKDRGPLPISMATSCIRQAARGLEYAHGCGVVHRDVKPSNLILGRDGTLRILDMGLVRLDCLKSEPNSTELTNPGVVMGSVDYMAPEQAADMRKSDARSDIYSLGYTLWYLLTGTEAYEGEGPIQRMVAHWERPLPSLRQARPEVSPVLESVFHKMVAKRPEDRYQTMTEVITELERARTAEAAAASHAPAGKDKKENEELTEFLRVLTDQPPDRGTNGTRPSGPQRAIPSSFIPIPNNPKGRSGRTVPSSVTLRKAGRHFLRKHALWLVAIAMLGLVIVVFFALTRNQGVPDDQPRQQPRNPSGQVANAPQRGANSVVLTGEQLSKYCEGNESWTCQKDNSGKGWVLHGEGQDKLWFTSEDSCYSDFTLWLDYRVPDRADSGVFLRADPKVLNNVEVQILEDQRRGETEHTGAIFGILDIWPPKTVRRLTPNKWHSMVVRARGTSVCVWIDDQCVNDREVGLKGRLSGHLGLEACEKGADFRNVSIEKSHP